MQPRPSLCRIVEFCRHKLAPDAFTLSGGNFSSSRRPLPLMLNFLFLQTMECGSTAQDIMLPLYLPFRLASRCAKSKPHSSHWDLWHPLESADSWINFSICSVSSVDPPLKGLNLKVETFYNDYKIHSLSVTVTPVTVTNRLQWQFWQFSNYAFVNENPLLTVTHRLQWHFCCVPTLSL